MTTFCTRNTSERGPKRQICLTQEQGCEVLFPIRGTVFAVGF